MTARHWLYRAEVAASLLTAFLFMMTLFDPMWIERWFDVSPDAGDGSAERWVMASAFLIAAILSAALARREKRALALRS
jgi:hypothetical protein